MISTIEHRANAIAAGFEPTNGVFNLSDRDGKILEALALQTPQVLSAFELVQRKIPLPRTAEVSLDGHFYRLPSQNRSFCYSLAEAGSFVDAPVLVFKGCEPLLLDFPAIVEWMLQAPLRKSTRVMADHFPLAEGKIPAALSLKEAIREAEIALEVQKRHLLHYGELAKVPTPLLIHCISDQKRDECATILGRKLSQSAFERIEPLLKSGLAVYVYHYPAAPIRASYSAELPLPHLREFIDKRFNPDEIVSSWVKLLVRLMYLGYLPYSVRNEGLGACVDFGNAALDGGFCDLDSIVPVDTSADDEFFRESAIQTLLILQGTVQRLLNLSNPPMLYPSIEEFVSRQYVHHLVNDAIESERRPALSLDERFEKLMSPRSVRDVKLCTTRRHRIGSYTFFSKRRVEK